MKHTQIDGAASAVDPTRRVRAVVANAFIAVAAAQDRVLQPLADDLALIDSGLDSLCIAIIVAQLEHELGLDPFTDLDDAQFPTDFGDFVRLYEAAHRR
ncbi:hypothetical protein LJR219_004131 [Phenylobacterium sp. LjRoot219]|uniref:hypothetical protein n=1 Tax=Phenylobacterium sp. LjRoot219 TaxID=3342283 RepID=UPI003ECE251C